MPCVLFVACGLCFAVCGLFVLFVLWFWACSSLSVVCGLLFKGCSLLCVDCCHVCCVLSVF